MRLQQHSSSTAAPWWLSAPHATHVYRWGTSASHIRRASAAHALTTSSTTTQTTTAGSYSRTASALAVTRPASNVVGTATPHHTTSRHLTLDKASPPPPSLPLHITLTPPQANPPDLANKWNALSVMRGSNALNILAKVCRSEWGAKLYAKTLIRQIGLSLYKDRTDLERSLRGQKGPGGQASPFQNTPSNGFQYGFKIRVSGGVGGRAAGSCCCWELRCCGVQWPLLASAAAATAAAVVQGAVYAVCTSCTGCSRAP